MAAKFEFFDFYKRFWNWLFQKCTFSGLSENLFLRSLKIHILPTFFCSNQNRPQKSNYISGYLFTIPMGKYWFVVHTGILEARSLRPSNFFFIRWNILFYTFYSKNRPRSICGIIITVSLSGSFLRNLRKTILGIFIVVISTVFLP